MKKLRHFVSIATIASLALVGCSQVDDFNTNTDLSNNESNAVQFGTYMGRAKETRAVTAQSYTSGPISNTANATDHITSLAEAQFGVFAYLTKADYTTSTVLAPNFMYNQQLQYDGAVGSGSWIYSPVKYWPNGVDTGNTSGNPSNTAVDNTPTDDVAKYGKKLSFFAFAPFTTTPSTAYAAATDGAKPAAITSDDNVKKTGSDNGVAAMTTNDFTGNVWVKYLLKYTLENQVVDLLWGTNGKTTYNEADGSDPTLSAIGDGYNMNLTKQANNEKVKFLFKHALAKIQGGQTTSSTDLDAASTKYGISVKLDVDGNNGDAQNDFLGSSFDAAKTLVTIKSVKIQDRATAKSENYTTETTTTNDLWKGGWFNIETGTWDYTGITQGATVNLVIQNDKAQDVTNSGSYYTLNPLIRENTASPAVVNATGVDWDKDASSGTNGYTGGASGVTVAEQALYANEFVPGLMLMPEKDQDLYVTIDYFVRTADSNLDGGFTEVEQVITNKVTLPAAALLKNKTFKLVIHLGLTSVKFEAKVADWQTNAGGSYDTDGNYSDGGTDANEKPIWLPSNVVE